MKWAVGVALGLLGAMVLIAVAGMFMGATHRARSRVVVTASADSVWAVVRAVDDYQSWWAEVESTEPLAAGDREGWLQHTTSGTLPIMVVTEDPPRSFVTEILDEGLPFGGRWTYAVEETPEGTAVTITEDGVIHHPIFRALARLVFGYHGTMDRYLVALGRRFDADVVPEHLP